jgi:hypothetical protein
MSKFKSWLSLFLLLEMLCCLQVKAFEMPELSIAYWGEMVSHPGASLGIEYPLFQSGSHRLFASAQLGGYTHPQNHTALFLLAQAGYLWQIGNWSLDMALGAGVMDVWLSGPVYGSGNASAPVLINDNGHAAFMPAISIGAGYDLPAGTWLNMRKVFVKATVFGEYPYNTYLLPHLAFQTGFQWQIGDFL